MISCRETERPRKRERHIKCILHGKYFGSEQTDDGNMRWRFEGRTALALYHQGIHGIGLKMDLSMSFMYHSFSGLDWLPLLPFRREKKQYEFYLQTPKRVTGNGPYNCKQVAKFSHSFRKQPRSLPSLPL